MCGIAGKLHWGNHTDENLIVRMCNKMIHRGPNDSGCVNLNEISLGHRRLSIIDLSQGAKQPMISSDNRYFITFNGEIYNFQSIKKELEKEGYAFRTSSDTEVIIYAYSCWGKACLNKFNGMFAFAIWDDQEKELFLARDRFGKKPLYYYFTPYKGIAFASELTALLEDKEIEPRLSYEALNCYLATGYIMAPLSIYKGINKLEAATCMLISEKGNKVTKYQYWDYSECFRNKTKEKEQDVAEHVLHLFEESVKLRMISDVPVGAFLSGGVDSAAVVSLMKKYHQGTLHTFSIGFEQESYNELADADKMGRHLKTTHHGQTVKAENTEQLILDAIDAFDEPFSDNSLIPMLEVSRLASKHVTVVLSGDGADELFAGYITYKADKYHRMATVIPVIFKQALLNVVKKRNVAAEEKINFTYKLRQFMQGTVTDYEQAHYLWRLIFPPEKRVAILGENYRQLVYDTDPSKIFKKYFDKVPDLHWLDRSLYVDAMTWLTDDILVKVDRTSMRCSIEARAPYLDVNLATYAASIPPQLKMNGLKTKYILKKALKNILPQEVLQRKKSGFNAPVGKWIGLTEADEFRSFNKFVYNRKIESAAKK